jgi:hypothetical protein
MMLRWIRWALLLPVLYACWLVALYAGFVYYGIAEKFCPPEEVVSGFCVASWFPNAEAIVVCLGAATAASLMVAAAAIVAPAAKLRTSQLVLAGGSLIALVMAIYTSQYSAFVAAVLAGAIALSAISWRLRLGGIT